MSTSQEIWQNLSQSNRRQIPFYQKQEAAKQCCFAVFYSTKKQSEKIL